MILFFGIHKKIMNELKVNIVKRIDNVMRCRIYGNDIWLERDTKLIYIIIFEPEVHHGGGVSFGSFYNDLLFNWF